MPKGSETKREPDVNGAERTITAELAKLERDVRKLHGISGAQFREMLRRRFGSGTANEAHMDKLKKNIGDLVKDGHDAVTALVKEGRTF